MNDVYPPAEDSYFLSSILEREIPKQLKKNKEIKVIEIGSGSGIQLETVNKLGIKKENIFSVDINKKAVEHCKKLGFQCIQSNLFSKIKGKFDLIIFNPPYLPQDKRDRKKDTTGGKRGDETIKRFLTQAKKHLNSNGKILLLISSLTPTINFKNYKARILEEKPIFFEKLYVREIRL
ncbi:MAG: HemK2/MTQ2 family protein methyltransferase [Nanoarchaeota archaeon]